MENKKESFLSRLFSKQHLEIETEHVQIDEASIPTVGKVLPQTIISFTPEQESQFTEQEKEELQSFLLRLPMLKIGELNFVPIEAGLLHGGYYVKVFIRNGLDVQEEIGLTEIPMYLLDAQNEPIAGAIFELKNFGALRFGETRVWTFVYPPQHVYKMGADLSDFTIHVKG